MFMLTNNFCENNVILNVSKFVLPLYINCAKNGFWKNNFTETSFTTPFIFTDTEICALHGISLFDNKIIRDRVEANDNAHILYHAARGLVLSIW